MSDNDEDEALRMCIRAIALAPLETRKAYTMHIKFLDICTRLRDSLSDGARMKRLSEDVAHEQAAV